MWIHSDVSLRATYFHPVLIAQKPVCYLKNIDMDDTWRIALHVAKRNWRV